jgi:hypothetical protein
VLAVIRHGGEPHTTTYHNPPVQEPMNSNRFTITCCLSCVLLYLCLSDRTPKQKLKIKVTAEPLLNLFHRHKDAKGKQVCGGLTPWST